MKHRAFKGLLTLCLLALVAACDATEETSPVELTVLVDADPSLRARIDEVAIGSDTNGQSFFPGGNGAGAVEWPFKVKVIANAANGTRSFVQVRALAGGMELVRRSANLKLPNSATARFWTVYLTSACEGVWESCDAAERGTCLPCSSSCESAALDVSKLPEAEDLMDAAVTDAFSACTPGGGGTNGSDGGDANGSDGGDANGSDGGDANGSDGGDANGSDGGGANGSDGGDANGSDGGGFEDLVIEVPSVVAAPGCVAVTLTRSDTSGPRSLTLSSSGGSLHHTADCSDAENGEANLSVGVSEVTRYFAPTLAAAANQASTRLTIMEAGGSQGSIDIDVRRRALAVVRHSRSACALADNATGSLYCVPDDSPRMVKEFDDLTPASTFSSFFRFTCALVRAQAADPTGEVRCWGNNDYGQLGDGSFAGSDTPIEPTGFDDQFIQVSAGVYHACAVKQNGSLYCWGTNTAQLINDSSDVDVPTPTLSTHLASVGETDPVVEVATGWDTTCVRTNNDEVYCWGNGAGFSNVTTAQKVNVSGAKHIAIGNDQVCVITDTNKLNCGTGTSSARLFTPPDGVVLNRLTMGFQTSCVASERELYCWGSNAKGWLGTSYEGDFDNKPDRVNLPEGKIDSFSVLGYGVVNGYAVVDGLVYAWGYAFDDDGTPRLGIDLGLAPRLSLTPNEAFAPAAEVAFSPYVGCLITSQGALQCWGSGVQLGTGYPSLTYGAFASTPIPVSGLSSGVTQVEVGTQWVIAIKGGTAYSWGVDATAQLGNGDGDSSATAAPMAELPGTALDVGAAYGKGCALVQTAVNERKVYCWGGWGDPVHQVPQLVLTGTDSLTDVDVQDREGCALDNGTVKCWRDRDFTVSVRSGMPTNVTKIEMDGDEGEGSNRATLCGLTADSKVYCSYGSDPALLTFTGVSALAAGAGHACVIKAGGVQCAGANRSGQVDFDAVSATAGAGPVPGLSGVTQIAAGGDSSCAKDATGWKCWGSNRVNELALSPIVVTTPTLTAPWR